MLEDFIQFVRKENLFQADQKILLAVSGGIDSVVMAKLFSLAKFNFGIAHVNFSLRGEESLADEVFVKKLAKTYKVNYHTICFDTKAFSEKEKLSTQMAARILRYDWFEEIRKKESYDYIATAHHQMDSAETVLINLSRGSGIAGFHGIPVKNGHIIRPMAFATQEQIFDFVVSYKLTWREDSSNTSTQYQRNFIRHEVMPKLLELNPHFVQNVAQSSTNVALIEQWMQAELNLWKEERCKNDESGNVFVKLFDTPLAVKEMVMRQQFLLAYHFNSDTMAHILDADDKQIGKIFESASHVLNIDRQQWVLSPKDQSEFKPILVQEEDETVDLGNQLLHIDFGENENGFELPTGAHIACLDADTLTFPLEIRKYQEGDWFCPLGMNQKKLISDFLTDKKVPLNLKKNVQLVLSKGSVVWVMGYRIDNRNKVTDKTEGLCILTLENKTKP